MKDFTVLAELDTYLKEFLGGFYSPVFKAGKIILIILVAILIARIGMILIKKLFEKRKNLKFKMSEKKLDTMATLIASVFKYAVYIWAILMILSDVLNLKSVLAAAGIGGVAIGLGAQSLIKDTLSGFFILLEDQFAVGDLITIDTMTGTVEQMELRVTRIKNFNGDLYIIPNGEIKRVTNHTRDNRMVIVDVPVAYSTSLEKAYDIAQKICDEVKTEFSVFTEEPKILGITELGKQSINMRITARTYPNEQWAVERRIRIKIKEAFEKTGLEFYDRTAIIREEQHGR